MAVRWVFGGKIYQLCTYILDTFSGGSRISHRGHAPVRGCGPPTQVLFGENVCENERIWSHRGGMCPAHPPRSTNDMYNLTKMLL